MDLFDTFNHRRDNWSQQGSMMVQASLARARCRTRRKPNPKVSILYLAAGKWHAARVAVVKKAIHTPPPSRFTRRGTYIEYGHIRSLGR